jgi:hypothetical protein
MSSDDLEGRPWFAYLARHTGCYVCQYHLHRALEVRRQLQELGGDCWSSAPLALMTRMGADLVISPDGELVIHHVCASPGDRADPARIVEALRRTVTSPREAS